MFGAGNGPERRMLARFCTKLGRNCAATAFQGEFSAGGRPVSSLPRPDAAKIEPKKKPLWGKGLYRVNPVKHLGEMKVRGPSREAMHPPCQMPCYCALSPISPGFFRASARPGRAECCCRSLPRCTAPVQRESARTPFGAVVHAGPFPVFGQSMPLEYASVTAAPPFGYFRIFQC